MSRPQLEFCEKCGRRFYWVMGELLCPSCEKSQEEGLEKEEV